MFQIAFGIGNDIVHPSNTADALRSMFSAFDTIIYSLINFVYQVLFNIADTSVIDPSVVKSFYGRVQLILGVFMVFKLSISILQYVINPDMMTDKKAGIGKVITRVLVVVAMITAIMPLKIPNAPEGSYNAYLNQHGLLFGTMYSLQSRVLNTHVLEKVVFGEENTIYKDEVYKNQTDNGENEYMSMAGNNIAVNLLKRFLTINVQEEELENLNFGSDGNTGVDEDSFMCSADSTATDGSLTQNLTNIAVNTTIRILTSSSIYGLKKNTIDKIQELIQNDENSMANYYNMYINSDSPSLILSTVNVDCGDYYAFSYSAIISTLVGIMVLALILVTCIDIAVRALKLAILKLISPIAIISYIDPKSAEKGAFANWVKLTVSTYIELFLRLIIVYFVTSIIIAILAGGLSLPIRNGVVGLLSTIVIVVGLLYFARQAPKFIMDALGIKSMGMGIGMSGLLGGLGAMMGGSSLAAGFAHASQDAADAAAQGKAAPPAFSTQRDNAIRKITGDDKRKGGVFGAFEHAAERRAMARAANNLYGVNPQRYDEEKNKMFDLEKAAKRAKDDYATMTKGSQADVARLLGFNYDAATGQMTDAHGNIVDATRYDAERAAGIQRTQDAYIKADEAYGIQKSKVGNMEKIADRMGARMTPEEEHRASIRENLYHAVHNPVDHFVTNHSDRQSLEQRVLGERDPNTGQRTNNRF